jgi:hypothetical protein
MKAKSGPGFRERLTERRAKIRATREERRKRLAMDRRMNVVAHRKGWETKVLEQGPGASGRDVRPPDFTP